MMKTGLRPNLSMVKMQRNCARSARTLLIAWYLSAFSADIPIWAKIGTEKYWIAETPVNWTAAWMEQARNKRRNADLGE